MFKHFTMAQADRIARLYGADKRESLYRFAERVWDGAFYLGGRVRVCRLYVQEVPNA